MVRIYHPFWKWEDIGMYRQAPPKGLSEDECRNKYAEFLRRSEDFRSAAQIVTSQWKYACEQNLTHNSLNRIAYLGQAAMFQATGIPRQFRCGFFRLTEEERNKANEIALRALNKWLQIRGEDFVTMKGAM